MKRVLSLVFIIFCFFQTFFLQAQPLQINSGHAIPGVGRGGLQSADINNDDLPDVIFSGINESGDKSAAVFRNNGDGTFTNFGVGLPQISDGDVALGDINNDGLLEILITGTNESSSSISKLFINQGSGVFVPSSAEFEGLSFGQAAISDLNNDGRNDILITGVNDGGVIKTLIYYNQSNDEFELDDESIEGVSNGSLVLDDFDSDGYQDVIVSGLNNLNQRVTSLYFNNKDKIFEKREVGLPKVRSGAIVSGDYNSDGFVDLFVSGNKVGGTSISEIYLNNNGAGFILDDALPSLEQTAAAWGDFDHDGDLDIAISGLEGASFKTYLFQNNNPEFDDSGIAFPGLIDGKINWIDYDSNNKLDLIITGFSSLGVITNVYENVELSFNSSPTVPTAISSTAIGDQVTLSWTSSTDPETSSLGLSYSIYIGSSPSNMDVVSPLSDISNGLRRVVKKGTANPHITINSLSEGIYYWSVQAIDAGFKGSAFAAEESFTICYPINIGQDTSICVGDNIRLEQGTATDVVKWSSKNKGLIATNSTFIDFEVSVDDDIYVELTNIYGCVLKDTMKVEALALPVVDLGEDQEVCTGSLVNLDLSRALSEITWYSSKGVLGTEEQVSFFIDQNDTIRVEVKDINMCANADTLNINTIPLPEVNLGEDQKVCLGTDLELFVLSDSTNWMTSSGLILRNSNDFSLTINEKDTLSVQVFDFTTNCTNSDTLTIDFFELPFADAGEDKVICLGAGIDIGGEYEDTTALNFQWSPSASLDNENIANPTATPLIETIYRLTVTDQNSCQNIDSVKVTLDTPSIIEAGSDREICIGNSTELGGVPTAIGSQLDYSFIWSPVSSLDNANSSNPVASPTETTTYQLITKTSDCTIDTATVTVVVNLPPTIILEPEVITIGFGEQVSLSALGGVEYVWAPISGLDNPNISNPKASPTETTIYSVMVTDENECSTIGEVTVFVKNQVFIPEIFTPNDDLNNDEFKIYGEGIQSLRLSIYDRNSNLVFESSSLSEVMETGWDGKKDGKLLESGTYIWSIEGTFFDGSPVNYQSKTTGLLKLIR